MRASASFAPWLQVAYLRNTMYTIKSVIIAQTSIYLYHDQLICCYLSQVHLMAWCWLDTSPTWTRSIEIERYFQSVHHATALTASWQFQTRQAAAQYCSCPQNTFLNSYIPLCLLRRQSSIQITLNYSNGFRSELTKMSQILPFIMQNFFSLDIWCSTCEWPAWNEHAENVRFTVVFAVDLVTVRELRKFPYAYLWTGY